MGMMDKAKDMKDKATEALGDDKAEKIDQAGDKVDEKTGGKYADKVDKGQEMAKDAAEKLPNQ